MGIYPQYDGKPDPWPGVVGEQNTVPAMDNAELQHNFLARYGQLPGNPGLVPDTGEQRAVKGWYDENFTANYWALKNACAAGTFGPQYLGHIPTAADQVDCAMSTDKNSGFYRKWWWEAHAEGGAPERPAHYNDPGRPHGPFVENTGAGQGWPYYCFNDYGAPVPVPTPTAPSSDAPAKVEIPENVSVALDVLRELKDGMTLHKGRLAQIHAVVAFVDGLAKG